MFKKKTILILGAGHEQLPAYKLCKKNSVIIIGVDKNKHAPGLKYAKFRIITSIREDEDLIKKIKLLKIKISAVLTIANDIPEIYYKICNELNLKNISKKSATLGASKIKLYNELQKNKILVPKFSSISSVKDGIKILKKNKYKFVLKPTDGRGSRGVNYVNKINDFKFLFADSSKNTKFKELILQKYIKGTQVSSESMIYNGKIFTILSRRNYRNMSKFYPNIIENGGELPFIVNKKIRKKIDDLILKISKILKIENSPLKCDLIIVKEKIYVLEATPRFGGGFVASHSSNVLYGVNFLELYIKILLGIKINKIKFSYKNKFLSLRFFLNRNINIKHFKKKKDFLFKKYQKNIVHKILTKKLYIKDNKIKSHVDRAGCVLIQSDIKKEAIRISEKIVNF